MSKFIKPIIILLVLIAIGAFIFLKFSSQPSTPASPDQTITLFYRVDCPHCQNVEKFLEENKVSEKISFVQKEVGTNSQNNNDLLAKAKFCKLNTTEVGVPFLWDGASCLTGDVDIIAFFQKKIEALNPSALSESCQALEKETLAKITPLLDSINYCESDSDCLDDSATLTCPFGCQTILRNKNADLTPIKDLTNKYYDACSTCTADCANPTAEKSSITCRNKKCITNQVSPE